LSKKKKIFKIDKLPHLSYDELFKVVSMGVFNRRVKGISCDITGLKKVQGAFYNGIYMGSPGKDIYVMLPYLSDEQIENIVEELERRFPKTPPGNHLNIAACIRFIYGQFEKNGILRSDADFHRMQNERPNWELPRKFMKLLYKRFKNSNNFYGLTILCEMEAHRLGDEAILNKNEEKLKEMEKKYNKAWDFAYKCKSYKHLFTPYFWSARYFMKYEIEDKAIKYSELTLKNADKYCPDARQSYIDKLLFCMKYLKKKDKKEWSEIYNKYKKSKNRCVKKAFKLIK